MFSLIITIISIALVAALALATLYYGSDAFNRGAQDAQASKLLTQGQQITGALTLYEIDHGSLPNTSDLSFLTQVSPVTGKVYLKTVPVAYLAPDLVQSALAQDIEWLMVPQENTIYTEQALDLEVCRAVNKRVRGDDGVMNVVSTQYVSQCYEESAGVYKLFVSSDRAFAEAGIPANKIVATVAPAADAANSVWAVAPDSVVAVNPEGPGEGGPVTPVTLEAFLVQGQYYGLNFVFTGDAANVLSEANGQTTEMSSGFIGFRNLSAAPMPINAATVGQNYFNLDKLINLYQMSASQLNSYAESVLVEPGTTICDDTTVLAPNQACLLYIEATVESCVAESFVVGSLTVNQLCSQNDPYAALPQNIGLVVVTTPEHIGYDSDPETYVLPVIHNFANVSYPRATPASSAVIKVYNTHHVEIPLSIGFVSSELTTMAGPYQGVVNEEILWQNFNVVSSCGTHVPARSTCDVQIQLKTTGLVQPEPSVSLAQSTNTVPMVSNFPYWAELRIWSPVSSGFGTRYLDGTSIVDNTVFLRWQISGY